MTLISYAQNHEDILLWRALKNIENGFYIDVGASDPFEDSVTQLFYERNWRGINIEPSLKSYQRLCQERTLDINLCCAVGDCQGKTTFYDIPTRGWSTSDSKVGEFYRQKGENVTLREVEILCLNSILESHQKPSIHFLKIDVEGSEKSVLKGLNLSVFRPWVLLVEAISPIDQTASYEEWEPQVLNSGYRFVYFDGLNRFYIAEEHYEELKQAFAYPPNVLDDFVSSSVIHWQTQAQQWQTQAQQAQARSQQLETELGAVLASRSWRLTSPLRKIGLIVRKLVAVRRKLCTSYRTPQSQVRLVRRKLNELVHKLRNRYRILQRQNDINDFVTNDLLQNFDIDAFALPLGAGQRTIYLFVDHTITCSTNTGVQRVTRALAAALVHCHERVRYIKWDSNKKKAVLINLDEREYLAHWNGPKVTEEDREIYSALNSQQVSIEPHISGENHWLIVPEVTHITNHDRPVTLDLILWARQTHLKVGFIFYDAIPLQRPEFADMAPKHRAYMQQLLLADMVWPISTWSAQDLLAYWKFHESADINTIPEVTPLLLSGESHLCERVLTPLEGKSLILSVGTLEPRKNQVALIQAFNSYCQDRPQTPWKLVLVGNLHPAVAEFVNHAVRTNPSICYLGHVSDKQLDELYRTCSFTVFPSTNEGFGLPILESLWYAKPCLCANFGSMAEVAKEGGCLAVDTRNLNTLTQALTQLIEDKDLRNKLVSQALTRPIRSWNEYAGLITDRVEQAGNLTSNINTIYYWVESSLQFPKNTGIQRVSRQLARALMEKGFKLIPVQWDTQKNQLSPVSNEELAFFAKWNGPSVEMWQDWLPPNPEIKGCWFLMAELPLNRSATERQLLLNYVRSSGLSCAAIFHDAIPWVMRAIYPPHFAQAHREYMLELNEYDLVLPISCSSTNDLIDFLGGTLPKPQSFNSQIKTVLLPGEFVENDRQFQGHELGEKIVKILCVGTVEPRKNHETLLKAFILAKQRSKVSLELVIVGGSHSIEPELADRVRDFILKHPNITWEENANDAQLQEFLKACDFTVYPSIKEGFGLPILESLWSAKPCICANFGSMKEVAEAGGCLMVDVTNVEALAEAIQQLANNPQLHQTLTQEAITLPFKSWHDYALEVAFRLAEKVNSPKVQSSPAPLLVDSPATQLDVDKTRVEVMNLSPRPLLSVCISTYNRAEWLATSLKNWTNLYPHVLPEIEFFGLRQYLNGPYPRSCKTLYQSSGFLLLPQ